jgi:hypothetical protein
MYESYNAGCVQSNNGTLLTTNAYSFAYNFAATLANEQMGSGLSKYDKQRTQVCTTNSNNFNQQQSNYQNDLATIRQTYDTNAQNLHLFQRCVNPAALPNDTVFFNLTSYHNPYLNATVTTRLMCARPGVYPTSGLVNGNYDCTLLPPCNLTCSGPDQQALAAVTYDSGCTSEWVFHAGLFRTLLGFLVYVSLNISRVLLMTGIIRLCWRQLTSKGFEFQGTCTKLGTIVGLEERLKVAVDQAIKSYERGAVVMIVGAVLVHIPYLVILSRFGNSTARCTYC